MAFRIQIRNYEKWEKEIIKGDIQIPNECQDNSLIISWILNKYASKVVYDIQKLEEKEIQTIAKSVAYLVRTDILKSEISGLLIPPIKIKLPKEDSTKIDLLNNPKELNENWKPFWKGNYGHKEDIYAARAAELFRCYWMTISKIPNLEGRLYLKGESFGCATNLANVTTYLLNPKNINDYEYTPKEIKEFNDILIKQMSEI